MKRQPQRTTTLFLLLALAVCAASARGQAPKRQPGETLKAALRARGITLGAHVGRYDRDQYNLLVHRAPLTLNGATMFEMARVSVATALQTVATRPGAIDVTVSFKVLSGKVDASAFAVDIDVAGWSKSNYVLLPGAAYDGNRFEWRRIPYSPKLYFPPDIGPDKPIIVSDIPKLNEADGFSRIQERSGSMSTPSAGFHSPGGRYVFWMLTGQGNALGDYGIDVAESRDRTRATISVTSPVVRELYNYRLTDSRFPSQDAPRDFKAGDEVSIGLRLDLSDAPAGLQSLFDRFAEIRKDFVRAGEERVEAMPFSASMAVLEDKFNRENFVPAHGYYSVGLRENFLQDWQIGWTGGMISTYPLLFAGTEATRRNVVRNFDWLFAGGISPAGFFYDAGKDGTVWYGGDIRKPHTRNWHLIRKSGDAVFYIVRQFMLMEKLGLEVKPEWKRGTRRVCDALVALWRKNGQFGQFVDSENGEIRVGGSSSGAIIPAALVLAGKYFGDENYLKAAAESGAYFEKNFLDRGISVGGPGDALQNPDSESWYGLVESFAYLFDATGDRRWLEAARRAGRQYATWVVSYDYAFPAKSLFGRFGVRSTGAVYANTQNKHAAPGICTFSGLALLRIYRATGDRFYLDLLADIAHGLPQYLPHPARPFGTSPPGRMSERVNMTDWEGAENIGEIFPMSAWPETSLMLTTVEVPGLYVRPDRSLFTAFDNISVSVERDDAREFVLRLSNPTPVAATVRILAETDAEAARPLAENALYGGRTVTLAPGASETVSFPKSGTGGRP